MLLLAHRLVAHGIGGRTVTELNDTMGDDEFMRWAAYLSLEPFPEQRADAHVAMVMAQQYNINRGKRPAKKATEFLPQWFKPSKPEMSIDQLGMVMRRQVLALGGTLDGID